MISKGKRHLAGVVVAAVVLATVVSGMVFASTPREVSVDSEGLLSVQTRVVLAATTSGFLAPSDVGPAPARVDLALQPNDEHTRELLQTQGIDPEYVQLTKDYGVRSEGGSPYSRTYQDTLSNKLVLETQGLPMVDADGFPVVCAWVAGKTAGTYQNLANTFGAFVSGTQVTLTVNSDQPDGRLAGQTLTLSPQLYLNEKEQKLVGQKVNATLLAVDPINENYSNNVLEWDYGACKRWLRIIEGRMQGLWLRPVSLTQTVRIKYNQTGDYKLKLGRFRISDDEELVPALIDLPVSTINYQGVDYYLISDSATYYPDVGSGLATVDGDVGRWVASEDWATVHDSAGNCSYVGYTDNLSMMIQASTTTDEWQGISRSIQLFDTSGLPDDCTVTAVTHSVRAASGTADNLGCNFGVNVYSSNPIANNDLQDSDYGTLGTVSYCDTGIPLASWGQSGWKDFIYNATGIAAVSKDSVTKAGMRASNDVGDVAPNWTSNAYSGAALYYADKGEGYQPKLVITYTSYEYKKPTAFTDTNDNWANEANAYDSANPDEQTTCASSDAAPNDEDPWITCHTWSTKGRAYTATDLFVNWKTDGLWSNDQIAIRYTKDGGSNWYDLVSLAVHNETILQQDTVSLNANQDLTQVQVKAVIDRITGRDSGHLYIYDIWTKGACAEEANIGNAPNSKAFGTVVESTTYWSNGSEPSWPLADSDAFFTVTNNGDACSIAFKATNWAGGDGWTLTSGSPGSGTVRLSVFVEGDGSGDGDALTTGDQTLISGLASSADKDWELKLETGVFTDGALKESTITLTATLD